MVRFIISRAKGTRKEGISRSQEAAGAPVGAGAKCRGQLAGTLIQKGYINQYGLNKYHKTSIGSCVDKIKGSERRLSGFNC